MLLQKPKIEFIPIELSIVTVGSICASGVVQKAAGGGQRCIASQEQGQLCDDWDTQVPWDVD